MLRLPIYTYMHYCYLFVYQYLPVDRYSRGVSDVWKSRMAATYKQRAGGEAVLVSEHEFVSLKRTDISPRRVVCHIAAQAGHMGTFP